MTDFQARFQAALRRRLYPNAPLHLKGLAGALGRAENTVARWQRGETRVAGEDLCRIAGFMAARGDDAFLQEIFGDLLSARPAPAADEEAALEVVRLLLRRRDAANLEGAAQVWFTADGGVAHAPPRSPASVGPVAAPEFAGPAAHAIQALGWIVLTEDANRAIVIRHDARHVALRAVERAQAWLHERAGAVWARRLVHVDGRWVEAHHATAEAAAMALARIAFILRAPRRPWAVRTLPLDAIADPLLRELMAVHCQAPHQLIHAAAKLGAFTTSSLFSVDREEVTSHHVATGFGFDTTHLVGMNVLARADVEYAAMVHARILRARHDGPSYNELVGVIDGRHVRYLNLALPEPGPRGRVLTSSVMLEAGPPAM